MWIRFLHSLKPTAQMRFSCICLTICSVQRGKLNAFPYAYAQLLAHQGLKRNAHRNTHTRLACLQTENAFNSRGMRMTHTYVKCATRTYVKIWKSVRHKLCLFCRRPISDHEQYVTRSGNAAVVHWTWPFNREAMIASAANAVLSMKWAVINTRLI